jgi:hypothetical protein
MNEAAVIATMCQRCKGWGWELSGHLLPRDKRPTCPGCAGTGGEPIPMGELEQCTVI